MKKESLLGVQLDDEVFLNVEVDITALRRNKLFLFLGQGCAAAQRLARPSAFQLFYLPAKRMLLPVFSGDSDLSLFSVIDTLPHKDSFFDKNNSIYYTPCQRRNKH
jgi:hypothetical protein